LATFCVLFASAHSASAAVAFVADRGSSTTSGLLTTFNLTPTGTITAGNFLVLAVERRGTSSAGGTVTCTSTRGGTWATGAVNGSGTIKSDLCYLNVQTNITAADTVTVTLSA